METVIVYEGTCPKCGSHDIQHEIWHNKCKDCGYLEGHKIESPVVYGMGERQ